jgi:ParB family chromosome partitioning protein
MTATVMEPPALSKPTRSNTYNISPFAVEIDATRFNSRATEGAYSPEKLRERAESMRDEGQLQPIKCIVRRNRQPLVVYGITRALAGRYGIEQGILPPDWTIRYEALDGETGDTKRLFLLNLAENHAHESLSPQDYAAAVARMKSEFKMSHAEIAKRLKRAKSWVSGISRIPSLPVEWQVRIGQDITQDVAINLARLKPEQAQRVFEYIGRKGWDFNMQRFKQALRESGEPVEASKHSPGGNKTSRTLKDVREFATSLGDAGAPLLAFLEGGDPEPLRALLALSLNNHATNQPIPTDAGRSESDQPTIYPTATEPNVYDYSDLRPADAKVVLHGPLADPDRSVTL